MPIYLCHSRKILLYNNYKCLYSTLYSIFKGRTDRVIYQEYPLDDLNKYREYRKMIIVRRPERRLESIYKDKIINLLKIQNREIYQDCQKVLVKTLKKSDSNQELRDISYSQFVDLVSEVYLEDQHFHPQYLITRDSKGRLAKFDEIINIESPAATERILSWVNQMLDPETIDQLPVENSTQHLKVDFKYQMETIVKINRLYRLDNLLFFKEN